MGYQIKSLNFSKSGQELVVMSFEDEFPDVISLKSYDIYQEAIAEQSARPQDTGKGKEKALTKHSADETSLTTRSLGILTNTNTSDAAARIVHREKSIVLDLKSPSGVTTGVELLALPQWQHLSEANVTVVCPQTRQEKINIILSTAADSILEISETVRRDRAYLPLHVQKDQRAVRAPQRDTSKKELLFMARKKLLQSQTDEQAVNFVKKDGIAIEIEQGRPDGERFIC
ncbi:hypothetical protein NA56DRAFT_17142 [Hyaloscypha hepaticicola]|uniref:Uncharacterized protein n=1 Tax=Hyaloscypha hepaticicola TaxID=2082293 RepID=A0A2J6QQL2_9HELO|nr:hypothetical protein NA56DRAFT_17142 [Hyaloscypha hepaticicola]